MREYPREPRIYELMTILSPEVPDDEITGALDQISGYITAAGGTVREVLRDAPWGRRRLAYPIRHGGRDLRDGFYTVYHLALDPGQVGEVERDLKLNDRVIRYLVTHYEVEAVPAEEATGEAEEAPPAEAPTEAAAAAPETGAEPGEEATEVAAGEAALPPTPPDEHQPAGPPPETEGE